MRTTFAIAFSLALVGCTSIRQTAESTGSGTNAVRSTTILIRTTGDARQVVDSLRAANSDKSQSLGAKGIEESGSTTNLSALIEGVVSAAIRAAK